MDKIRLKIGDTVKVITGTDKGSIGEITSILRKDKKVVVSDVNKKFKHVKPRTKEVLHLISNVAERGAVHDVNG